MRLVDRHDARAAKPEGRPHERRGTWRARWLLVEQQRGLLEHRSHVGDEVRDDVAVDDAVIE